MNGGATGAAGGDQHAPPGEVGRWGPPAAAACFRLAADVTAEYAEVVGER